MTTTIINPELVAQINTLVQAWNTADRRVRDMFHGWEQRATRAGLESGFYLQLSALTGAEQFENADNELDRELLGRAVYDAYLRGGVTANLDSITN